METENAEVLKEKCKEDKSDDMARKNCLDWTAVLKGWEERGVGSTDHPSFLSRKYMSGWAQKPHGYCSGKKASSLSACSRCTPTWTRVPQEHTHRQTPGWAISTPDPLESEIWLFFFFSQMTFVDSFLKWLLNLNVFFNISSFISATSTPGGDFFPQLW